MILGVTVGTTRFDDLVAAVILLAECGKLSEMGFNVVVVQSGSYDLGYSAVSPDKTLLGVLQGGLGQEGVGEGAVKSLFQSVDQSGGEVGYRYCTRGKVHVLAFGYCSSLSPLLALSSVVLGHAGTGTVLESLHVQAHRHVCSGGSPLQIVLACNTTLLHNHQRDLASALDAAGVVTTVQMGQEEENEKYLPCAVETALRKALGRSVQSSITTASKMFPSVARILSNSSTNAFNEVIKQELLYL